MPASKMKVMESMEAYEAGLTMFTRLPDLSPMPTPAMLLLKPCDWSFSVPSPNLEYEELLPLACANVAAHAAAAKSVANVL